MRYSHLVNFSEIGEKGQKELEKKTVTIVGIGSIGSTVAVMLARSGVNLRLVDKGRCLKEDLSAQSMYLEEDDTRFKAKQAKKRLEDINPSIKVKTFHEDLTKNNTFLLDSDVVVDTTGNMETSKLICEHAKKRSIPVIFGIASASKGLVVSNDKGMNVDKLRPYVEKMKQVDEVGLISPTVHMASALIVKKIFKILLKKPYHKEAVVFDIWTDTMKRQKI